MLGFSIFLSILYFGIGILAVMVLLEEDSLVPTILKAKFYPKDFTLFLSIRLVQLLVLWIFWGPIVVISILWVLLDYYKEKRSTYREVREEVFNDPSIS